MSDLVERLEAGICDDKCKIRNIEGGCTCAIAAARIKALEEGLRDARIDLLYADRVLKRHTIVAAEVQRAAAKIAALLGGSNVSG